jgi:plasmid stabilization system protein ParE
VGFTRSLAIACILREWAERSAQCPALEKVKPRTTESRAGLKPRRPNLQFAVSHLDSWIIQMMWQQFTDFAAVAQGLFPHFVSPGPTLGPSPGVDATYVKVRRNHRIVSVAVIVAVGVNADGRREVLGMDIGPSEAETFWTEFLRKLRRRGLRGVKLVVSDAHEGIKAAVAKLMNATWRRCRVHTMRNALAHAGKSSRRVVSAFMATAFAQDSAEAAKAQWRKIADQLRTKLPKLALFPLHGRGRGRRPRLHGLPRRSLAQDPFHQWPRTAQRRNQTAD